MTDPFAPSVGEPVSLIAGAFAAWRISLTLDPTVYTLKYVFLQGNARVELAGTCTDGVWHFEANAAFTETLGSGRHILDLVAVRTADAEPVVIRTSTIQCFASSADRTSHSQIMVDKIESVLSGRADSDVESYTIKSRSISKMSVAELTSWRDYYLAELGREPDPITGRRKNKNTVKVGFI